MYLFLQSAYSNILFLIYEDCHSSSLPSPLSTEPSRSKLLDIKLRTRALEADICLLVIHLVNNASIGLMGILETHPAQLTRQVFDTNFFGVVRLTKAVIPKMKSNREGHIINISSMAGVNGVPFNSIYSASKFAVEGMSESLAPLLKKFNVK